MSKLATLGIFFMVHLLPFLFASLLINISPSLSLITTFLCHGTQTFAMREPLLLLPLQTHWTTTVYSVGLVTYLLETRGSIVTLTLFNIMWCKPKTVVLEQVQQPITYFRGTSNNCMVYESCEQPLGTSLQDTSVMIAFWTDCNAHAMHASIRTTGIDIVAFGYSTDQLRS